LPAQSPFKRTRVFGFPVDAVSMQGAVGIADAAIRTRARCRLGSVNAAKLVSMQKDPGLARAVSESEIVLPDGVGVVWAARLLEGVHMRRVTGIDLMERLVALAAERGYAIFFLGARDAVLRDMLERLGRRYPGFRVAGARNGYFGTEEEADIVAGVRESGADILFVGMGTPAKELWIDRHHEAMGVPVCMGVGGSFDVFGGHVQRAPRWMQRLGLEWFHRFLQEPRRMWRRYFIVSTGFFLRVLGEALRRAFRPRGVRSS